MTQMVTQATEPDPTRGPGARRITPQGAPERRLSITDPDRRHGRKRSAKPCNGFQEPLVVDLDSTVTREVVVRPAHEPAHAVVPLVAQELTRPPGLLQLAIALGDRARPQMMPWGEPGVHSIARPWPHAGPLCTTADCTLDCAHGTVTCPGGQTVPRAPGTNAPCPASACEAYPQRTPCTKARIGQGRRLDIRQDEQCQRTLRATIRTQRGRASLRKRTAVEHAIAQPLAPPGRRARSKGRRKNQWDSRRPAALSHLQVAAQDAEARQLAS